MLKSLPQVGEMPRVAELDLSQSKTVLFLSHAILFSLSHSLSLSIALPILPPQTLFFPVSIESKDVVVRNSISPVAAFIIYCEKRCFEALSLSQCWAFCRAGEVRVYVTVQHCVECGQWSLNILNYKLRQAYDYSTLL